MIRVWIFVKTRSPHLSRSASVQRAQIVMHANAAIAKVNIVPNARVHAAKTSVRRVWSVMTVRSGRIDATPPRDD